VDPRLLGIMNGAQISDQQIDVSFLCVCPLIDDKLRHNIVKVAVEPRASGEWFRRGKYKIVFQYVVRADLARPF